MFRPKAPKIDIRAPEPIELPRNPPRYNSPPPPPAAPARPPPAAAAPQPIQVVRGRRGFAVSAFAFVVGCVITAIVLSGRSKSNPIIPVAPAPEPLPTPPPPPPPPPTCQCPYPGTTCDDKGVCRLQPRARWKVSAFVLKRTRPDDDAAANPGYALCFRPTGEEEWTCSDEREKYVKAEANWVRYYYPKSAPAREITTEQILDSGIDIAVRENGVNLLEDDRRYRSDLIASKTLFEGGLLYRLTHPYVSACVLRIEPIAPEN